MTFFRKVDRVWRKLKRNKITGVRGLCCGTCSACEGGDRMDNDPSLMGYAYYHVQDRERAEETGLYIGYGGGGDDQAAVVVARNIKALFEADGFGVDWDGSPRRRLRVFIPQGV
jgi:hypothetical protein